MSVIKVVIVGVVLLFIGVFLYEFITFENLRNKCLAVLGSSDRMIRVDFENVDDQVIQDFTDTVRQIGNVASVELEWPEERVRQYLKDPDNIDPQTEEVLRQAASDMSVVMDVYFESEADEDVIRQEIETSAQEFNIPIDEIHTDSLVWVEKKIKDASFIMATFMRGFDSSEAGGLIVDREALKACINNG